MIRVLIHKESSVFKMYSILEEMNSVDRMQLHDEYSNPYRWLTLPMDVFEELGKTHDFDTMCREGEIDLSGATNEEIALIINKYPILVKYLDIKDFQDL